VTRRRWPRHSRVTGLAVAVLVAGLAFAVVALASPGELTYKGCIANKGRDDCKPAKHESLDGPFSTVVSPDGQSVYVGGYSAITRFDRGPGGALIYAGCVGRTRDEACKELGKKSSLEGVYAMAISPDGRSLYAISAFNEAVMRFDRGPNGALKFRGCVSNGGRDDCRPAKKRSLGYGFGIAVSPDGKSVYVSSLVDEAVTRFKRGPNGAIIYAGCVADGGLRGCKRARHDSLEGSASLAVAPDGSAVYAGSEDSITSFKRGPNGGLTYRECIADERIAGCKLAPHESVHYAYGIAVSPGGESIYLSSYRADSITRFTRRANGALRYSGCIADQGAEGCKKAPHRSLNGVVGIGVSGDGTSLYAVGYTANSITRFRRGPGGALSYRGCIANHGARGCDKPKHDSLDAAVGLAISPDDKSVYVASLGSSSITHFTRQLSPP
jgi:DNA-binding beta-propeller fold protein YncE